jgi:SSS family transporter
MMDNLPLIAGLVVLIATIVIGLWSARKSATLSDYWVAGRSVGVFTNASAISSNYLSAASFLGVAAAVWGSGFDGVWYATGFAAGYILLLFFIASPLRRFGKYTIPDFCEGRFNSRRLRQVGITCTMVISTLYIIAQMVGVGTVMEAIVPGMPFELGLAILGTIITLYVTFGGMTGVTLTQMLQFWIMITAILLPLFVLLPKYGYGEILQHAYQQTEVREEGPTTITGEQAFTETEQERFPTGHSWIAPFGKYNLFSSISLLVALVCGTAGLPHILARFYTNPDGAKARWSTVWVLVFIGIFYITTPIWGAYGRMVLGVDAVMYDEAGEPGPNTAMFLISEQAGQWAKALIAAGGVAAVLSTISGLLIALSSAIAHDLYGEILKPDASDKSKIIAAKVAVIACGVVAILLSMGFRQWGIAWMVGLAFAVAASTLFPLLVSGIWWSKMTEAGAIAGASLGGIVSTVIVVGRFTNLWAFDQPALISVPLAFIAIFVVSKMTWKDQSEDTKSFLNKAFHALHRPDAKAPETAEEQAAS